MKVFIVRNTVRQIMQSMSEKKRLKLQYVYFSSVFFSLEHYNKVVRQSLTHFLKFLEILKNLKNIYLKITEYL